MLDGKVQHDALIATSVVLCGLGAIALTAGLFMSFCYEECAMKSLAIAGLGGISFMTGMGVGNYTKKRSRH